MSVAKVTEIISASTESVEDAVKNGVKKAAQTINGIESVWVKDIKARVNGDAVTEWRCTLKITFVVN